MRHSQTSAAGAALPYPNAQRGGRLERILAVAALWSSLVVVGCSRGEIETDYGVRSGKSVNGTGAFADMLRQQGFRVATWKRFSPKLDDAELLVWFHDAFEPPTAQQREFVERWMSRGFGRTMVYVGRDFDGEVGYWQAIDGQLSGPEWLEARRRLARAKIRFDEERAATVKQPARWFSVNPEGDRYRPTSLSGPWAEGVDASQTSVELQTKLVPTKSDDVVPAKPIVTFPLMVPPTINRGQQGAPPPAAPPPPATTPPAATPSDTPPAAPDSAAESSPVIASHLDFTPLLTTDRGDVLAMRVEERESRYPEPPWNDGQLIVVANGSFLLNVALANHENRKLAAHLIAECGEPKRAVFLESSSSGLPVFGEEPDEKPNGFELFRVWPLNVLLSHLVVLGILYCVAMFPIFGRPKQLPREAVSDFGKHITALGEMLEKSRNATYARQLLANYHALKTKDPR